MLTLNTTHPSFKLLTLDTGSTSVHKQYHKPIAYNARHQHTEVLYKHILLQTAAYNTKMCVHLHVEPNCPSSIYGQDRGPVMKLGEKVSLKVHFT